MNGHEEYEAGVESRREVLHGAGRYVADEHRADALLRYMRSTAVPGAVSAPPPAVTDEELRSLVAALVRAADGEPDVVIAVAGSVWLRGTVPGSTDIAALEHAIREVPGVLRLDSRLTRRVGDAPG